MVGRAQAVYFCINFVLSDFSGSFYMTLFIGLLLILLGLFVYLELKSIVDGVTCASIPLFELCCSLCCLVLSVLSIIRYDLSVCLFVCLFVLSEVFVLYGYFPLEMWLQ